MQSTDGTYRIGLLAMNILLDKDYTNLNDWEKNVTFTYSVYILNLGIHVHSPGKFHLWRGNDARDNFVDTPKSRSLRSIQGDNQDSCPQWCGSDLSDNFVDTVMNKSLHNIHEGNHDRCPSSFDSDAPGSSEGMVLNNTPHDTLVDNPDMFHLLYDSDAPGSSEGMVLNNTPHDTLLDNPDMFHLLYDSDAHDSSVDTLSYTFLHSSLGKDNLVNVKNKNGIG